VHTNGSEPVKSAMRSFRDTTGAEQPHPTAHVLEDTALKNREDRSALAMNLLVDCLHRRPYPKRRLRLLRAAGRPLLPVADGRRRLHHPISPPFLQLLVFDQVRQSRDRASQIFERS
jgi:hypothetical protein